MTTPSQLKKPAIALLVGGIVLALYALLSTILQFSVDSGSLFEGMGMNREAAMLLSTVIKFQAIVSLVLSGIVIFGALAMLKQTSYALSMTGSICGIIGGVLSGLLGWLLVLPVSIWAVVTLRKPANKHLFNPSHSNVEQGR
jgi:hypothetical protein